MTVMGAVAIGRNEGERLRHCLRSLRSRFAVVIYVDSGSTDGSRALAQSLGAEVVELDTTVPFTAARARNSGYTRLVELQPDIDYVQFIDGDCEMNSEWPEAAAAHLDRHPQAAVVCGRRRERYPAASVYNRLCDIEWNGPLGRVPSCGGDAMVRRSAFDEVGGYDPSLIAGEEPDMCYRMASAGWEVWRIAAEMTLHDAAMTRFSQWWQRNVRSGHASAEALARRGFRDRATLKRVTSNVVWSLPIAWPLLPVLGVRVYRQRRDLGYAASIAVGKLPHMQGQVTYWLSRLKGTRSALIEYK